ncbi:MAG: LysE family transporter [Lachnospiraceae bacterium]|jgi:threonine/homoserine/homoserine lactone efflux protein|nr:LysE family transporter [Lachnospiraceae bacterium]
MSLLLKGILIGLLFGVPVGAVGAMTVQRTWEHGIREGLLTGMGSSAADCIYAGIGAFGLTMVSEFLLEYQTVIHLAGSAIMLYLGICLFFPQKELTEVPAVSGRWKMFLTSFAVGITNPAAILTFLFAFSWFGITGGSASEDGWLLVAGVFIGTYLWWGALCAAVALAKSKKKTGNIQKMNRIFGAVLSLFGVIVFMRAILV